MTDREKLALAALARLLEGGAKAQGGELFSAAIDDWRKELYSIGVLNKDHSNPRADFRRLKDGLAAKTFIAERDGLVWIP